MSNYDICTGGIPFSEMYKKYLGHATKEQRKIIEKELRSIGFSQVYLFAQKETKPSSCPFSFMDAKRQTEPAPPSAQTLALWRAISFHGG